MDEEVDLSEDEVTEVFDHLQGMMDAVAGVRRARSDPEQRRSYWSKYFQHQAAINRLIPQRRNVPRSDPERLPLASSLPLESQGRPEVSRAPPDQRRKSLVIRGRQGQ